MKKTRWLSYRALAAGLLLAVSQGFAQPYSNEWINFNQTYYKISVGKTGFYKLTYTDLQNAGFPVQTVDPRRLQLFFRGMEQPIEVSGQLDARFDPADYIVFYGQKNDGMQDKELYVEEEAQPHNYHNLFSDTTAYFLTWRLDTQNGRRVQTFFENNVSGLPAEPFYYHEDIILRTSDYVAGRTYPEGADGFSQLSAFDYGEGWTGARLGVGQHQDFTFDFSDLLNSGEKPVLDVLLAGRNNRRHRVEIFVGSSSSSLRSFGATDFYYLNTHRFTRSLEWSDFGAGGELTVRVLVRGFNDGVPDYASVSYVKVRAPRQWRISADTLHRITLRANTGGKSYVEIDNELSAFAIYDISDTYNLRKIGYNHSGGTTSAVIDGADQERTLLINNNDFLSAPIARVSFRQVSPAAHDYLIVSHSDLMNPSGQYADPVAAYANYRASAGGGGLSPVVVDIRQLFDQFAYGEKTPLAIRRFCDYMLQSGADEKYLFLIGKGLDVNYNYYRQDHSTYPHRSFVPPAGFPGADMLFTAGLKGTGYEPAMPTGRITAETPNDVEVYLNKIKEMESAPVDDLWRKELIHLSGGLTVAELTLFNRYVEEFQAVAESDYLGGKVDIVSKKSNSSVELINISEEINNGKTLVTFFGHSGGAVTDLDIGFVSDDGFGYSNKGKYPTILVNGCNAGHIFSTTKTFGEDWMLTPNRGSIAFIANVTFGYASYLKRYTDMFYGVAFGDSTFINRPIGAVHLETTRRFLAQYAPTTLNVTQARQMVLQGDPFYRMFPAEKPDYAIRNEDLLVESFDGGKITALTDSFKIGAIVKNFGRTDLQPLQVVVERFSESGESFLYDPQFFPPVRYSDTLWFTIKRSEFEAFGKNTFQVRLDYADSVPELNEGNNEASVEYFIPLRSTRNLAPYDFGIVSDRAVQLLGQSSDLMGAARDFIIEIDTTIRFNSPFKKQWTVNAEGIFSVEAELLEEDSVVYFWRTRFASPQPDEDNSWSASSFTYIHEGPEGWAQAHFDQILQNSIVGLTADAGARTLNFEETELEIDLTTYGPQHPEYDYEDVVLYINGQSYIFGSRLCTNNSINMIAFDESSTQPYLGLDFGGWDLLDRRRCGRRPQLVNNFLNTEIEDPAKFYINQFIDNIPDGDYALLFSIGNVTYENWPQEVKDKVFELGVSADLFTRLQNGYPLIILGVKGGAPGSAIEVLPDMAAEPEPTEQELSLQHMLAGKYTSASISTPLIGPALQWNQLYASIETDGSGNDFVAYDIVGVKSTGEETVLYDYVEETSFDLAAIDAANYPYLKLHLRVTDEADLTAAQLKKWIATFDPAPEGVIAWESEEAAFEKQEGEEVEVALSFENISDKDFADSILVNYSNFNAGARKNEDFSLKIPAVKAGEKAAFTISIPTIGRAGVNDLKVDVNPRIQPEQSYYNNFIGAPGYLEVKEDNTHPVIEVTVDGRYLIDGDIVSPSPLIVVRLKDENKYVMKQDTAGVDILMKRECDECTFERIDFSQPHVQWTPATENQDFQVQFQPPALEDGVYVLQAQASDGSGNPSGANPFRVRFEVVNESTVTNFYPYPNPFSTSTRFIFTLTGSDIPERIKIQIMTISGKIVREITQDELGPIHIGHNITDFAWDGRDEFGDQLANGVYLYRVVMDRADMDHRQTKGDRAFKNGFGKLYLLR